MDAHRLKFGRDVTIAAAATATRSGRNLLLLPLLTRFLTPDDFGLYSQIAVTVALLIPWVSLQLSGAVVHFLAGINARGQIREGFYSILLFVGLCGSLCALLVYLFLPLLSWLPLLERLAAYAGAIALLLAVTAVNDVVLSYFRAFRLMVTHSALALGHNTVEILAIAIAVWHHPDLQMVLLAMVAARCLSLSVGLVAIAFRIGLGLPRFHHLRTYLDFSLPLVPESSFYRIFDATDRYVLGAVMGTAAVGLYHASFTAASLFTTFLAPVNFVMLPLMADLWNNDRRQDLGNYMTQTIRYAAMLVLPAFAVALFLAEPVLSWLLPPSYAQASTFFPLLALGFVVYGFGVMAGNLRVALGETRLTMRITGAMALMNVALNLLLIPMAGIMGAIAATLASHLFYAAANLILSRRRLHYRLPWRPILHYGEAATAAGLLVAFANTLLLAGPVVLITGGGILYLALLWWTGGISSRELLFLHGMLSRRR